MIFNSEAVEILKRYNEQQEKVVFSDDTIVRLQNGMASFKETNEAEKVIENYVKRLKMPPSRIEVFATFISKAEFNSILLNTIFPVFNEYIVLKEIMISKGITTQDEIDAHLDVKEATRRKAQEEEKLNVPGPVGTN